MNRLPSNSALHDHTFWKNLRPGEFVLYQDWQDNRWVPYRVEVLNIDLGSDYPIPDRVRIKIPRRDPNNCFSDFEDKWVGPEYIEKLSVHEQLAGEA